MRYLFVFAFVLSIALESCLADNTEPSNLAQFRRMPGVEVFVDPDHDISGCSNVTIELLDNANYLGVDFKSLGPYRLTVSLMVKDQEGHMIINVPLHRDQIGSGESRSGKMKYNFTRIRFEIQDNLLQHAGLDFHVQPMKGGMDIWISLGTDSGKK